MKAINKETILHKTHYGLTIYSHILRLYYPNEVVLRLVERDCGLSRNPFNSDKETLHIFIEKTDPTNAISKELACHEDIANAILAGNAFDFAELHYKQQGSELLQTINKELNLRIGEERNFYRSAQKSIDCLDTSQSKSLPFGEVGGALSPLPHYHQRFFAQKIRQLDITQL